MATFFVHDNGSCACNLDLAHRVSFSEDGTAEIHFLHSKACICADDVAALKQAVGIGLQAKKPAGK